MLYLKEYLVKSPQAQSINLEFLGIRDATLLVNLLSQFPNLKALSFHGNHLKFLPIMNLLETVVHLDVKKNPLVVDSHLLDALYSLPNLTTLQIDASQNDLQRIVQNLPNLFKLNGKQVRREKKKVNEREILKKLELVLEGEKNKLKDFLLEVEQKFDTNDLNFSYFESEYEEIISEFYNFAQSVDNQNAKEGVFIYSKTKILDLAEDRIITKLYQNMLDGPCYAFQKIKQYRRQYFDTLLKIILQTGYDEIKLEQEGGGGNSEHIKIKLRKQKLYMNEIARLKKTLSDYRVQMNDLEEENKKAYDLIFKVTGQKFGRNQQKKNREFTGIVTPKNDLKKLESIKTMKKSREIPLTPNKSVPKLNKSSSQYLKSKFPTKKDDNLLTLEQTQSLMDEIMKEKQIKNKSCRQKKQPYLTMQQFLQVFFNRKYGLKDISVKWILNFIHSLQAYHKQKPLFQVFLKILKNKIEENFFSEHQSLIKEIQRQTREHFKRKYERLTEYDIVTIFQTFFPEEEEKFILKQISTLSQPYNEKQVSMLIQKTNILIHDILLKEFVEKFAKWDRDEDGILNCEDAKNFVISFFKQKIRNGMVEEEVLERITKKIDPYKKNRVLFYELVQIIDNI